MKRITPVVRGAVGGRSSGNTSISARRSRRRSASRARRGRETMRSFDVGTPLFRRKRNQHLADAKLGDDRRRRISGLARIVCAAAATFWVARREGAQGRAGRGCQLAEDLSGVGRFA